MVLLYGNMVYMYVCGSKLLHKAEHIPAVVSRKYDIPSQHFMSNNSQEKQTAESREYSGVGVLPVTLLLLLLLLFSH